jgi:apolipoprotein N-acyltransferase
LTALMNPGDLMLLGALKLEFDRTGQAVGARNAVMTVHADGTLGPRYDKAHLVPYGEYLPMRPLLSAIGLSRLAPGDLDFWPGPGPHTLDLGAFGKAGLQICYEIIFSGEVVDRAHRPDFIFNPSNDAWFGAWGPPQHLAQARLRAIEEGLPVIRATPTAGSSKRCRCTPPAASMPSFRRRMRRPCLRATATCCPSALPCCCSHSPLPFGGAGANSGAT